MARAATAVAAIATTRRVVVGTSFMTISPCGHGTPVCGILLSVKTAMPGLWLGAHWCGDSTGRTHPPGPGSRRGGLLPGLAGPGHGGQRRYAGRGPGGAP